MGNLTSQALDFIWAGVFITVVLTGAYTIAWLFNKKELASPLDIAKKIFFLTKKLISNTKVFIKNKQGFYKENPGEGEKIVTFLICVFATCFFYYAAPYERRYNFEFFSLISAVITYIYAFFVFKGIIRKLLYISLFVIAFIVVYSMDWWTYVGYGIAGACAVWLLQQLESFFLNMHQLVNRLSTQNEEIKSLLKEIKTNLKNNHG